MNISTYKIKFNQIHKQRNQLLVLISVSSILNIMLVGLSYKLSDQKHIIVTPPLLEEAFWIENKNVSSSYLRQMADYFCRLILNTTSAAANARREAVLTLVDNHSYAAFQQLLVGEEEKIKSNNFITIFNPTQYVVDVKQLKVDVVGDLKIYQGKEEVKESRKTYRIQFSFSGKTGKLLVKEFKDVTDLV